MTAAAREPRVPRAEAKRAVPIVVEATGGAETFESVASLARRRRSRRAELCTVRIGMAFGAETAAVAKREQVATARGTDQ